MAKTSATTIKALSPISTIARSKAVSDLPDSSVTDAPTVRI